MAAAATATAAATEAAAVTEEPEAAEPTVAEAEAAEPAMTSCRAVELPGTLMFDHPTARQLTEYFAPKGGELAPHSCGRDHARHGEGSSRALHMAGTSGLFPAGAASAEAARGLVAGGQDAIGQVPLARWDTPPSVKLSEGGEAGLADPVVSRMRHAGLVWGVQLFDRGAFAISPAETRAMDPQQRLLLERGYMALHLAGSTRAVITSGGSGIFIGIGPIDFFTILMETPASASVYAVTGASISIASGRMSYALGLQGPCVSIDTACSGGLAALHAGLRSVQLDECPLGLSATVNLMLIPANSFIYAVASLTSPNGRSHTWDKRADGFARGEGCVAVTLRHHTTKDQAAIVAQASMPAGADALDKPREHTYTYSKGTHMLTQGHSALGLLTAKALVQRDARRFLICQPGRVSASSSAAWPALRGGHVRVVSCDLADPDELTALLSPLCNDEVGIRSVFHDASQVSGLPPKVLTPPPPAFKVVPEPFSSLPSTIPHPVGRTTCHER